MVKALANTIDQTKSIEGQITMAVKSSLFRNEAWILVESTTDQKIYQRFFKGKAMVLPAIMEDNKKPNCCSVEQIVTSILDKGSTDFVIGIRDTDYTRYWHERTYNHPKNVIHTHHRDIEMTMLSAKSCQTALFDWDCQFCQRIKECSQYISYMGYLRVWFDNYADRENHNLKKFKWGRILDDKTHEIADDWKERLTDRFNKLCDVSLTVDNVEEYARKRGLDKLSIYDICRGHDFLLCLANSMTKTDIYSQQSIRDKMSDNYSRIDFWSGETGCRIKKCITPWKSKIIKY